MSSLPFVMLSNFAALDRNRIGVPSNIKKGESGIAVAHSKIKSSTEGSFSTTRRLSDAPRAAGRFCSGWRAACETEFGRRHVLCRDQPIDPGADPRNRSLKTRMGKKELAPTAKRSVMGLATRESAKPSGFNPVRSRSMVTLPFSTIIFWSVPAGASASFLGGLRLCSLPHYITRSESKGSARAVSVFFDMVRCSNGYGRSVKAGARELQFFSWARETSQDISMTSRIKTDYAAGFAGVWFGEHSLPVRYGVGRGCGVGRTLGIWNASGCGSRPRSRSRSRCRCRATLRRLDFDTHWRTSLKEAYCRVRRIWRLVGVKPEVIQRAEANGIGVCVLRDSFAVPSYRRVARLVIIRPRRAAVPGVSLGAIVCEARMLRRRMKPDVTDVNSRS